MPKFARLLYRINMAALFVAGLSILAISLLGGVDILSTLIFSRPIHATYEATQTLMVIAVFLGLGMVHLHRSYISVDLGYDLMGRRAQRVSDIVTLLMMIVFYATLSWRGWQSAVHSWEIGEYSSGIVPFPVYPARFALAFGCTLALVCAAADLMRGGRFRDRFVTDEERGEGW